VKGVDGDRVVGLVEEPSCGASWSEYGLDTPCGLLDRLNRASRSSSRAAAYSDLVR